MKKTIIKPIIAISLAVFLPLIVLFVYYIHFSFIDVDINAYYRIENNAVTFYVEGNNNTNSKICIEAKRGNEEFIYLSQVDAFNEKDRTSNIEVVEEKSNFLFYDEYMFQNNDELNEILKKINADYTFRIHKLIDFDIGRSSFYKESVISKSDIRQVN